MGEERENFEFGVTQRVDPDQITIATIQAASQRETVEAQERMAVSWHAALVAVAEKYAYAGTFAVLVGFVLGLVAILHG